MKFGIGRGGAKIDSVRFLFTFFFFQFSAMLAGKQAKLMRDVYIPEVVESPKIACP